MINALRSVSFSVSASALVAEQIFGDIGQMGEIAEGADHGNGRLAVKGKRCKSLQNRTQAAALRARRRQIPSAGSPGRCRFVGKAPLPDIRACFASAAGTRVVRIRTMGSRFR